MKKILITGANSYIGTSLEKWLQKNPEEYFVDTVDMMGNEWREKKFSGFDVVFHVAGIAHVKETNQNRILYYKVNRDLAYEAAKKSKNDGIKQFIFLSSMSVYGLESGVIDKDTPLNPNSAYGKSKLEAEEMIKELAEDSFLVTIIRPPMVYGKGCKGNYSRLAKLALKTPIFPDIDNKRSMIYIDNLSEFIRLIIDAGIEGVYFPQNKDYINTTELTNLMAKAHGKKIKLTKFINFIVKLGLNLSGTFRKVFGNLIYDLSMSGGPDSEIYNTKFNYETCSFEESIRRTENAMEKC
jgi:UDP-glucose 4-epimerase